VPIPLRIVPLLACAFLVAACDSGGSGRPSSEKLGVRFDTVAGYRLGMLLPEARAVARRYGQELDCRQPTDRVEPGDEPDSVYRDLADEDNCSAGTNWLHFRQGSLLWIRVPVTDDWRRIPVDTLVNRLAEEYGEPKGRRHERYPDGQRSYVVYWRRRDLPGNMYIRCPEGTRAGGCVLEFYLEPPDP
jgi:hypothetical protein